MLLNKRARWMLLSGIAGAAAAHAAEYVLKRGWEVTAGTEPPEDPTYDDVDWTSAVPWAATAAIVGALSEIAAQQGAASLWRRTTGKRPPGPRRRKRVRSG